MRINRQDPRQVGHREKKLLVAVIQRAAFDYAFGRRRALEGTLTPKQKQKLDLVTHFIFHKDGDLKNIVAPLVDEPEFLIEHLRAELSDDKINDGVILGKKLREDEAKV